MLSKLKITAPRLDTLLCGLALALWFLWVILGLVDVVPDVAARFNVARASIGALSVLSGGAFVLIKMRRLRAPRAADRESTRSRAIAAALFVSVTALTVLGVLV